ncbi:methylenetetrahydrofolate--tRNA-(uracil(54)-C(5))-methyltransferase (FADH(2)-oxidizing) TrmFO [Anaerotardibacter muris]|uniref:methylenetetrahydrofolate--tRNA-(uracil(54)- C(5))-methyltransferase (FADH(2)-oxidizing) TrmFO n=1 Tax=Anaerotardibacter muris TaxID=2941505 RepID=UPI0020414697|nr:methylenetetrahydrofolate--tRNA-(uracil(54)-C(5))-methyltransferase (FADH(2)-oxidizing) TrmFO [Anaerotardibacter muris]
MEKRVDIIGGGLAGSEAALQLAADGFRVRLIEMRPFRSTGAHETGRYGELVCSNSLKSTKPASAAGMLKAELEALGSRLLAFAYESRVPAGGALAVDRDQFSGLITDAIVRAGIERIEAEVVSIEPDGTLMLIDEAHADPFPLEDPAPLCIVASGPLTSPALAESLQALTGQDHLAFYDAAAPIVFADSLDLDVVFTQSRYEDGVGDYLNAPFNKEEYGAFIDELVDAQCVIKKSFETKELFQACQPIEEIARKGFDAPRFGPLKPVGLTDPRTDRRPWAVVQLRAEGVDKQCFNLVGFQTNLTFPEQERVFRMIPGLENAQFERFGVMHRNTFINAPALLDAHLQLHSSAADALPVQLFIAGQLGGTEGYVEAIASGLLASMNVRATAEGVELDPLPRETALGALIDYATDPSTQDYQPMHVNFGILPPFEQRIRNKQERYERYAQRGSEALDGYLAKLAEQGLAPLPFDGERSSRPSCEEARA